MNSSLNEVIVGVDCIYVGFHRVEYRYETIRGMNDIALALLMAEIGMNATVWGGVTTYCIPGQRGSITDERLRALDDAGMDEWWGHVAWESHRDELRRQLTRKYGIR